jgi:hypothetical protein
MNRRAIPGVNPPSPKVHGKLGEILDTMRANGFTTDSKAEIDARNGVVTIVFKPTKE